LRTENDGLKEALRKLSEENQEQSKELSSLRNRTTLSQQNWTKERDDLINREQMAQQEFEAARQAMQDWEVLAMEERSIRENLADRVDELDEQLRGHRSGYDKTLSERDTLSLTVEGLQRALQDMQDGKFDVNAPILLY
jgi:chromosome segregation ATPase